MKLSLIDKKTLKLLIMDKKTVQGLGKRAKEAFANTLIDTGVGMARYTTYIALGIPTAALVNWALDEKNTHTFSWPPKDVICLILAIFFVGIAVAIYFRNIGVLLLDEIPDCCERRRTTQEKT